MPEIDWKKYSVAEVALLAIFVLGLAIAHFMVRARSDITLSRVSELPGSGLQVLMPAGSGWRSEPEWKFAAGAYSCTATYGKGDSGAATRVTVQYILAADKVQPDDVITLRAAQFGGTITASRTINEANPEIHAAQIDIPRAREAIIIAAASLGMGRMFMIEVLDQAGGADWAWVVIEKVAAGLKYKPNADLHAGCKVVESLKTRGFDRWAQQQGQEKFFLISDKTDNEAGFVANLCGSIAGSKLGLRFVTAYYLRNRGGQESILQCDPQLKQWAWISNVLGLNGDRTGRVEAYLDPGGQMFFKELGNFTQVYRPGPAALPKPVLQAAFLEMTTANISTAIFDVIDAKGRIVPTNVSISKNQDQKYKVQAELLDGTGEIDKILFDPNMNVIRVSIVDKVNFDWRPAARADVLSVFEPLSDYLDSLDSMLRNALPRNENSGRSGYNDPTI